MRANTGDNNSRTKDLVERQILLVRNTKRMPNTQLIIVPLLLMLAPNKKKKKQQAKLFYRALQKFFSAHFFVPYY